MIINRNQNNYSSLPDREQIGSRIRYQIIESTVVLRDIKPIVIIEERTNKVKAFDLKYYELWQ
jgi:hypothetical protein